MVSSVRYWGTNYRWGVLGRVVRRSNGLLPFLVLTVFELGAPKFTKEKNQVWYLALL